MVKTEYRHKKDTKNKTLRLRVLTNEELRWFTLIIPPPCRPRLPIPVIFFTQKQTNFVDSTWLPRKSTVAKICWR